MSESPRVHAWLIVGKSEGRQFLADVWLMLGRLAARAGGELCSMDPLPERLGHPEYFALVRGDRAESRLLLEVGVHRAQSRAESSATGRIRTSLVGVEILAADSPPSNARPSGAILKTYNYVLKGVTHHPSGTSISLNTMLAGEWNPNTND